MPILDLQTRSRELGRIRIGKVVTGSNGKVRPEKLDSFRITSASQQIIERIAELYGGQARPWTPQGGGAPGWEVTTTSTRLPVLVPPQPVSQWYELWSGGGCQRRCDGVREVTTDAPCLCGPDPDERDCKPTTRLNVVLREVEGIGVFRLESHGYYAATELPEVAEFLARTSGYVSAWLTLEERVVKRDGKTRRFMVPALEVDITPAQLLAGGGGVTPPSAVDTASAALPTSRAALPAAAALDSDSVRAAIAAVTTVNDLRALWPDAKTAGLEDVARARAAALEAAAAGDDPDAVWATVLRTVPDDWTTDQAETNFVAFAEVPVEQASAADMRRYLNHLTTHKD